jgi:hypothetical protein
MFGHCWSIRTPEASAHRPVAEERRREPLAGLLPEPPGPPSGSRLDASGWSSRRLLQPTLHLLRVEVLRFFSSSRYAPNTLHVLLGRFKSVRRPGTRSDLLIDLHLLDQRPHDLTPRQPTEPSNPAATRLANLQLTDYQPQLRVPVLHFDPLLVLLLQPRQPLPRRRDPRLELRLVQEAVPIRIDQSRDCLSHMIEKLGHLTALANLAPPRPFQPPPVFLSDALGLGQQRGDVLPHRSVQLIGPDSPGPTQLLSVVPPRL